MSEFKRKKGESFEAFLRRFNKKLKSSRKLNEARSRQHIKKDPNKNAQKKRALVGLKIKSKMDYMRKVGKIKEDDNKKW